MPGSCIIIKVKENCVDLADLQSVSTVFAIHI